MSEFDRESLLRSKTQKSCFAWVNQKMLGFPFGDYSSQDYIRSDNGPVLLVIQVIPGMNRQECHHMAIIDKDDPSGNSLIHQEGVESIRITTSNIEEIEKQYPKSQGFVLRRVRPIN